MPTLSRLWPCLVTVLQLLVLGGCAVLPGSREQAPCREPRTVYAVNQGWHVGLAIEAGDLAAALPSLAGYLGRDKYAEIGWGDRDYYQDPDPTVVMGLKALFVPTESVLHVVAFHLPPAAYFSGHEVIGLRVEDAGYRRLIEYIAESFALSSAGQPIPLGDGLYGRSLFYLAEGGFHAFNNCNTWVARALRLAGYPLSPLSLTASPLMRQVRGYDPDLCFPVSGAPQG